MPIRFRYVALAFAAAVAASCVASSERDPDASDRMTFWDTARRGANSQNASVEPAYWAAVARFGIEFIRLLPDAWPAAGRDFLIGNADAFTSLERRDLEVLRHALDDAYAHGVYVVVAMLSVPGARWRQLNDDTDDARLWTDPAFRDGALAFWRHLAGELHDHPAVVAYNPLNEPHPERAFGFTNPQDPTFPAWRDRNSDSLADLNRFNREIVAAIREADPDTPIILDGWFHASPSGITFIEPVADTAVLYAFHYYEPWEYTTFRVNRDRFRYPESMPGPDSLWTRATHARLLDPVEQWARRHDIPSTRIIASEFGVDRRVGGAGTYLTDLIAELNARGWHWAFYAFRGDGTWGGMDYELGTGSLGARFWDAVERGADPETLKHRHANPLWAAITRHLPTARRGPD